MNFEAILPDQSAFDFPHPQETNLVYKTPPPPPQKTQQIPRHVPPHRQKKEKEEKKKDPHPSDMSITNYQFVESIGQGSYGQVRKVRDPRTGCFYAIKKALSPSKARPQEYKVHQRLSHPNIIGVLDSWTEDSHTFLLMEYANGGSLDNYFTKIKNRTSTNKGLFLQILYLAIQQIASGLVYLHEIPGNPLIHLDLKPANIFIVEDIKTETPTFKIGDFGHSVYLLEQSSRYAEEGDGKYCAPELLSVSNPVQISPAADVYSFGLLILSLFGCTLSATSVLRPWTPSHLASTLGNEWKFNSGFINLLLRMLDSFPKNRPTSRDILSQFSTTPLPPILD